MWEDILSKRGKRGHNSQNGIYCRNKMGKAYQMIKLTCTVPLASLAKEADFEA